jgi:hypothetical protein
LVQLSRTAPILKPDGEGMARKKNKAAATTETMVFETTIINRCRKEDSYDSRRQKGTLLALIFSPQTGPTISRGLWQNRP